MYSIIKIQIKVILYPFKRSKGRILMKVTGISRPIDEMGRIVIPKEIRRSFDIQEKDLLEIFIDGDSIILKKATPACALCGSEDHPERVDDKYICKNCIAKIASISLNNEQI